MIMNSYATFLTYEFIYEFMYMKNIVKSYLKACVPRFQMVSFFFSLEQFTLRSPVLVWISHQHSPAGLAPSLSVRIARCFLAAAQHPHGQATLYELPSACLSTSISFSPGSERGMLIWQAYASLVDPPPNPHADTLGSRPTRGRFAASRFAASASRNPGPHPIFGSCLF